MSSLLHQVSSITPWTPMNGLVFTCDICSVALQSSRILPECNWTEFTTQDALHVMLVFVFKQGSEENSVIFTVRTNPELVEIALKCTVNVYCCGVSLEGAWVEMYNVLCNGKATIILSCGEDKWSRLTRRLHHPTQGLLSIFTHLLIVYGLETRGPREPTA